MKRIRLATVGVMMVAAAVSAIAAGSGSGARLVFPNPFTTEGCTFTLTMPNEGRVRIVVYDLLGRQVADLTERSGTYEYKAGTHPIFWDGSDQSGDPVPAGTYVCVLWSGAGEVINSVKVVKAIGIR